MTEQARSLARRSHVVVSTPGRLVDHIRSSSNAVDLSRLKVVVLDEADRLLGAAFATEMKVIFGACNPARQTLLFSATMSANLSRLQKIAMNGAFVFDATPAELRDAEGGGWKTPACLQQQYMFMPAKVKETYLVYLLRQLEGSSVIVFTSSRGSCNMLFMTLLELDIECVALHSDLSQSRRSAALAKFKGERARVLVSTDVGSRGLDLPAVEVVINYNVPANPKDYIHRVGRTARAGRKGRALTLVSQYDVQLVKAIEKTIGKTLELNDEPEEDVLEHFKDTLVAKRTARLKILELEALQKVGSTKQRKRKASWATSKGESSSSESESGSEIEGESGGAVAANRA